MDEKPISQKNLADTALEQSMTQRPGLSGEAVDARGSDDESSWSSLPLFIIKLVLLVLIFRSFVFAPFTIPSESMLPRLLIGDYLLAAKWPYGYSRYSLPFDAPLADGQIFADLPERGDIAIFKHPIDGTDYIKRVIGLPGDRIALRGGRVMLNGVPLAHEAIDDRSIPLSANTACHPRARQDEENCSYKAGRETLPSGESYDVIDLGPTYMDNYGPVTVPEGHFLVLGDNRDNSQDSRFDAETQGGLGLVPVGNLFARASIIIWSTDGSADWGKPWTWFTAARWDRIGTTL